MSDTLSQLKNQLIVVGATRRLEELNKEREQLIGLINQYSAVRVPKLSEPVKPVKAKRKYVRKYIHWTQVPANREKMLRNLKRAIKAKR